MTLNRYASVLHAFLKYAWSINQLFYDDEGHAGLKTLFTECETLQAILESAIGEENMKYGFIEQFFKEIDNPFDSEPLFYKNFVNAEKQLQYFGENQQKLYYDVLFSSAQRLREYLQSLGPQFTQFNVNSMIQNLFDFINLVTHYQLPPDPS